MGMRMTDRMQTIIECAEEEAAKTDKQTVSILHLLIAFLKQDASFLAELSYWSSISIEELRCVDNNVQTFDYRQMSSPYFSIPVEKDVTIVFASAIGYMQKFNQIYLNEGHLLKALLRTDQVDKLLTDDDKFMMISLGATARDMITHLGNYSFPNIPSSFGIRRVYHTDRNKLVSFVYDHFSREWSLTIERAFVEGKDTIYVATDSQRNYVGFAAFDIFQNKKNYFGPMGVKLDLRGNGIGFGLLHHCLRDMKEIGYEYAILGGAGPIEFYEKACKAVIIPIF
ncbi:GNAT family N-acetyltransferase [Virgibacillus salarius]